MVTTEADLVGICHALGASRVRDLSSDEKRLLAHAREPAPRALAVVKRAIAAGGDPLGDAFCVLRSPAERRPQGATYTPVEIVQAMVAWTRGRLAPGRIVDPGVGSGRFLIEAAAAWPAAALVGVDVDPVAALMARAMLSARGLASRAAIRLEDYRAVDLSDAPGGPTLFIGNPPYVRHHQIGARWKNWLTATARRRGLPVSQLAGLHVHFFLATLEHARPGDCGVFVTAAEWLDVNYGALVRELLLGELGGLAIHVIEPKALPFSDAATTAAITCFEVGARPRRIAMRRVDSLAALCLDAKRRVDREQLEATARWTPLTRAARAIPRGFVELGELCRVRRGQVTGANAFWIHDHARDLPDEVLFPTVTRARELFAAGTALRDVAGLRRVIDLPDDLDTFEAAEKKAILALLRRARSIGVPDGYIARARRTWWHVGLHEPAPILATYMARRPPAFVRNLGGARHINIAHGLYPREPLPDHILDRLAAFLCSSVSLGDGRTYAGGLVKFEPREMERLRVPSPDALAAPARVRSRPAAGADEAGRAGASPS